MDRRIAVRVNDKLYDLLVRDAKRGERSIGAQARYIISEYYREHGEVKHEDDTQLVDRQ
ncbi:MAG: hypothetical protein M1370_07440 [Bacteroidetes bacterium]|nr:hypothetical protein [Bacteroidota bacterium]